jgi:hypothetical protein
MKPMDDDPLLAELRSLPRPELAPKRRAATLRAAEKALSARTSSRRWPELALASVLAASAMLYAVQSMGQISRIYGSNAVASADP